MCETTMERNEKEFLAQELADANRRLREANAQLEEAQKKLKEYEEKTAKAEKASEMKTLFLANMSHEIRTPLNAIEGFSRVMSETDSQDDRLKYMEIIESNNNRLLSLVNEILDLSRVESGEIVIKKNPTNLSLLMNSIHQSFKFRCHDTVSLKWQQPEQSVIMNTDENRITQVFSNLISNALKHTPKGSITYGYRLIDGARKIEFFVSDTGSGIDPNFVGKIFDVYASQDAEHQRGYGLGLSLCRIIVEKMGGTINVKSELGKGSTFTFCLPFTGTIDKESVSNRSFTARSLRTLRVDNVPENKVMKTVLVAEDEENNYELVHIVLKKRYNLLRAHNGIEAVTMNEEQKPDLILMDIRMPGMNGLDATRIIKEVSPNTPVIALSAFAFEENIREAKAAGCDAFVPKPFKVEDLIEIIKRYIGA